MTRDREKWNLRKFKSLFYQNYVVWFFYPSNTDAGHSSPSELRPANDCLLAKRAFSSRHDSGSKAIVLKTFLSRANTAHSSTYDPTVGLRVARFGLFEAKNQIWPFLKLVGLEICYNLLSSWPYFWFIKVSTVKSKMLPFLKQRFAFVSYKHLATLAGLHVQSEPPPPCV